MRGKPVAERIRAQVAEEVKAVGGVGITTVLVGDDPASQIYIGLKYKAATAAGMHATDLRLPADISEDDLREQVLALPKVVAATENGVRTVIVRAPKLVNVVPA